MYVFMHACMHIYIYIYIYYIYIRRSKDQSRWHNQAKMYFGKNNCNKEYLFYNISQDPLLIEFNIYIKMKRHSSIPLMQPWDTKHCNLPIVTVGILGLWLPLYTYTLYNRHLI